MLNKFAVELHILQMDDIVLPEINPNPLGLSAKKHLQSSKINHNAENQWHTLILNFQGALGFM